MSTEKTSTYIVTWSTTKLADGRFKGTCYAFGERGSADPETGRYTTKHVTLHTYIRASRNVAKTAAIKACRYYKHNLAELDAKMMVAFPAHHVTDNAQKPA